MGSNVFLGQNVQMYAAYHPVIAAERIKGPEYASPINIGDNVWSGGSAIITAGVVIGDKSTPLAQAVLCKESSCKYCCNWQSM